MIVDIPDELQAEIIKVIPRAVTAMFGGTSVEIQEIKMQNLKPVIVNIPEEWTSPI